MKLKKLVWIFVILVSVSCAYAITIIKQTTTTSGGGNENYLFDMIDFADSCSLHTDVTLNTSFCGAGETPSFWTYNGTWNALCCDFVNARCDNSLYDTYNESVHYFTAYTGYSIYLNSKYSTICCDINGKNCYMDNQITVGDETTACNKDYYTPIFNIEYQATKWNITSCMGAVYD